MRERCQWRGVGHDPTNRTRNGRHSGAVARHARHHRRDVMEPAPRLCRVASSPPGRYASEPGRVLALPRIETALRGVAAAFEDINPYLKTPRDRFDGVAVDRMMCGYAAIDELLARNVDLLSIGQLRLFLELNASVLCGCDDAVRADAAGHLAATETQFFDAAEGGIRDVVEWHTMHRDETPWLRAAGVYIRVMSEPQLFIEGNHRTGTLLMSFILARAGHPPFVVTRDNVLSFLDRSSQFTTRRKSGLRLGLEMPWLKRRFAAFLKEQANPAFLRAGAEGNPNGS
jgi:hypothetical protein